MKRLLIIIVIIMFIIFYYKEGYDNNILKNLYFLWGKLEPILKKHDIHYFAVSGTLLGAVRERGIILHDDDIDIGVMENEIKKFKTKEFLQDLNNEKIYIKNHNNPFTWKVFSKELKIPFFIDIFSFREEKGKISHSSENNRRSWPDEYFYNEELFPLKDYSFGEKMISGPCNPFPYLNRFYGEDWTIPKNTHNHLSELGLK